ncbi:hypothetical protein FRC02_009774 [Tulasnella sp. 418]|nr:hypothetical protein FRC02_009774 [Tulasnella sp. 418]
MEDSVPNVASVDEETAWLLNSLNVDDKEETPVSEITIQQSARKRVEEWEKWKQESLLKLKSLKQFIATVGGHKLSIAEKADIIAIATSFDEVDEEQIPLEIRTLAQECLESIIPVDEDSIRSEQWRQTISEVLQKHIKPLFLPSQHPSVNLDTGRKTARPAGGPNATHDLYDDQPWKIATSPGGASGGPWNVIRWCINHADPSQFETLWPGLIPPIMTMMDDYQPIFRIRAITTAEALLQKVDEKLLKRTGLNTLFSESLKTALTYSTSSEAPTILKEAAACTHLLIEKMTAPNSKERFDQLCDLIKAAVIGGPWIYAGHKVDVMVASVVILPPLLKALGIGSVRFLKALIPQLSDNLITKPHMKHNHELQLVSADCLVVVIHECKPRIQYWKNRILNGLVRSWIRTKEEGKDDPGASELQQALRALYKALLDTCPSIQQHEMKILQDKVPTMFEELIS